MNKIIVENKTEFDKILKLLGMNVENDFELIEVIYYKFDKFLDCYYAEDASDYFRILSVNDDAQKMLCCNIFCAFVAGFSNGYLYNDGILESSKIADSVIAAIMKK